MLDIRRCYKKHKFVSMGPGLLTLYVGNQLHSYILNTAVSRAEISMLAALSRLAWTMSDTELER